MNELGAIMLHRLIARPEQLAFHVVAVHKNSAALQNSFEDNIDGHVHDHLGPCGLRNHPLDDFSYDENELEAVLEEAEEDP